MAIDTQNERRALLSADYLDVVGPMPNDVYERMDERHRLGMVRIVSYIHLVTEMYSNFANIENSFGLYMNVCLVE